MLLSCVSLCIFFYITAYSSCALVCRRGGEGGRSLFDRKLLFALDWIFFQSIVYCVYDTYMYVCVFGCRICGDYICVYLYIYAYMYMCMCVYVYMCMCVNMRIYAYMYVCVCV